MFTFKSINFNHSSFLKGIWKDFVKQGKEAWPQISQAGVTCYLNPGR